MWVFSHKHWAVLNLEVNAIVLVHILNLFLPTNCSFHLPEKLPISSLPLSHLLFSLSPFNCSFLPQPQVLSMQLRSIEICAPSTVNRKQRVFFFFPQCVTMAASLLIKKFSTVTTSPVQQICLSDNPTNMQGYIMKVFIAASEWNEKGKAE